MLGPSAAAEPLSAANRSGVKRMATKDFNGVLYRERDQNRCL